MFRHRHRAAGGPRASLVGLSPTAGQAQDIEILMALPAPTLTFSSAFIAEDAGFYKKEGLKVSHRILVGVASPNAVIAGSADFTIGTGPVFLRAAAAGQRMLAIANLIDKPLVELVLRKDVADAAGITDETPLAERAKALKGKTIAIQGVGSIVHAWERFVASRGGLDIEKDVRIAPMDPPGHAGRRWRPSRSTASPPRCRSPPRRWSRARPSCWRAARATRRICCRSPTG